MPLELSRLQWLRCGPPGASTVVSDVPPEVADYLSTSLRMVNLSREVLAKINEEHGDIVDFTFLELPHLMQHGLWIGERRRPLCAVVSCEGAFSPLRYKVAIKRAAHGPDLWLSTFHRARPRVTKSLLNRGHVIRRFKP